MYSGPADLVFIEQGTDLLKIRWAAAGGPVTGYRIHYLPLTSLGQQIMAEMKEVSTPSPCGDRPLGSQLEPRGCG